MNPTNQLRFVILRSLKNKSIKGYPLKTLTNKLNQNYDQNIIHNVVKEMDMQHEQLINFTLSSDPMGKSIININVGHKYWLTPNGQAELDRLKK